RGYARTGARRGTRVPARMKPAGRAIDRHGTGMSPGRDSRSIRDAASPQSAVPARVLVQILLVIVLRIIELWSVLDLRRDLAMSGALQRLRVALAALLRKRALLGV